MDSLFQPLRLHPKGPKYFLWLLGLNYMDYSQDEWRKETDYGPMITSVLSTLELTGMHICNKAVGLQIYKDHSIILNIPDEMYCHKVN